MKIILSILILYSILYITLSIKLDYLYYSDVTLSTTDSPYEVEGNVIVSQGVTLTIENGVQLTFLNDSNLIIRGSIIVGCNELDTSSSNYFRGLANDSRYTYIHGTNNNGQISYDKTASTARFCNVLFEQLEYAFSEPNSDTAMALSFDNCQFRSSSIRGSSWISSINATITNSWFYHTSNSGIKTRSGPGIRISGENIIVNNCLIENLQFIFLQTKIATLIINTDVIRTKDFYYRHTGYEQFNILSTSSYHWYDGPHTSDVAITNSTFINYPLYNGGRSTVITSCVIANCTIGVSNEENGDHNAQLTILYSEISNCSNIGVLNAGTLNIESSTIRNSAIGIETKTNYGFSTILSSQISNCSIGLLNYKHLHMEFNDIINNEVGIKMNGHPVQNELINYNNFIQNQINIDNKADFDQLNISLNYFGANITDQAIISDKIKDICDGYSAGLIRFWPWLLQPHTNLDNIGKIYTFDFTGCSSINNAKSYVVDTTPIIMTTTNPAIDPTMDPAIVTTINPTVDPMYDPTRGPTVIPLSHPSSTTTQNPTIESTLTQSLAPTVILPNANQTSKPSQFRLIHEPSTIKPTETASPSSMLMNKTRNEILTTSASPTTFAELSNNISDPNLIQKQVEQIVNGNVNSSHLIVTLLIIIIILLSIIVIIGMVCVEIEMETEGLIQCKTVVDETNESTQLVAI